MCVVSVCGYPSVLFAVTEVIELGKWSGNAATGEAMSARDKYTMNK